MYAILRTEKLKTPGNIGGLSAHLTRSMHVPNADPELIHLNSRSVGSENLWHDVQNRIEQAGIQKVRKDAVLAVEHLMTYSPEGFSSLHKSENPKTGKPTLKGNPEELERWYGFVKDSREWLENRYGKENLVNFTLHLDERTPHIHAIVVPIYENKLNCKHFLGGREKLRAMQSSFAHVHRDRGLERGVEGSKVHHQELKHFYGQVKEAGKVLVQTPQLVKADTGLEMPSKMSFMERMSFDPTEWAKNEYRRLTERNTAIDKHNQQAVQQTVTELGKQATAHVHSEQQNRKLTAQVEALQKRVKQLETQRENTKLLLEAVAKRDIEPEKLTEMKTHVPKKEQSLDHTIYLTLKDAGFEVKQEERTKNKPLNRGMER